MANLKILQLAIGPMENYVYLIADEDSKSCAVCDPGWSAKEIEGEASKRGWKIEKILLTHTHFDHAQETRKLAKLTGATVCVHKDEGDEISDIENIVLTENGTDLKIGAINIRCIHTPGHTPGSQCFLIESNLLTGDTLFVDGCGRVDLPGGDVTLMLDSLKRLSKLPENTIIYPGHNYGSTPTSTIGAQRRSNQYMTADSEEILL